MDSQRHAKHEGGPDLDPSDRELIDRVRAGDLEAFDPLYRRHRESALRHARYWTRSEAGSEDLCAESFTRVLYAIRNGNGPTEAFRPYLLTAMRNVARDWAEGDRRTLLVPDLVDLAPPEPDQDPVIAALERSLAGLAFSSLPERWQTVLWQTEVEQEAPSRLAPQLGIDAAAVSALAYRAREGLKQAYLQAHITEIGSPACRPFAERLGSHTRGKLRGREAAKVRQHLRHCSECVGLFAMLKYVNGNLGALIGPAVVGTAAAVRIGVVLGGAGAGAGAGAGGGSAAQHGLLLRTLGKARHASPRQQAVAAGTAAAVAAAALAFALTGNATPPHKPVAAAKPSPSALPPTPVSAPAPASRPPAPAPKPSTPPSVPVTVATSAAPLPAPKPAPSSAKPVPSSPAPTTAPPSPTPSPSPSSTVKVQCPNALTAGQDLAEAGFDAAQAGLAGLGQAVGPDPAAGTVVVLGAATGFGDAAAELDGVIISDCSTGGPPHPVPLPDLTSDSAAGS
jgi:RNA polymerase sigma factor (sigma-70 family)